MPRPIEGASSYIVRPPFPSISLAQKMQAKSVHDERNGQHRFKQQAKQHAPLRRSTRRAFLMGQIGTRRPMDVYFVSLVIIGASGLAMTWLPTLMRKIGVSYAIPFIGVGMVLYTFVDVLPSPMPFVMEEETVRLTELLVIIALMNAGLRIDRPFSLRKWAAPLKLATVAMGFSIGALAGLSAWLLGFDAASAVLLGAALAPTDPVLATDVQVGPPNKGKNDDKRFALTAEAGFNDGMAFPFIWMAVALALAASSGEPWVAEWFWRDFVGRILIGAISGLLIGKAIAFLTLYLPDRFKLSSVREGVVALSATLLVYGVTELLQGYGFIAVFVAGVAIRNYEREHDFHQRLHAFSDQIERFLLAVLLILFGGSLISGILEHLTLESALLGVAFLLVIRPIIAYITLLGRDIRPSDKWAVGFFGIRGVGSFFYLSFALNEAEFPFQEEVWSLIAFVVLVSILVHGLTSSAIIARLDQRSKEAGVDIAED